MKMLSYLLQQNPNAETFTFPIKENPSYGSEMPQDFPYDPGATGSLFELGYIPTKESFFSIGIIALFCLIVLFVVFRQKRKQMFVDIAFLLSIALVFLGPLSLPAVTRFHTTIGVAKMIALVLIAVSLIQTIRRRLVDILRVRSFVPICLYLITLLFSVFTMTNTYFFMQDMSLIIGGIMFYYVAFEFSEKKSIQKSIITLLSYATLFPSSIVLFIYFFRQRGIELISSLYPRYENIVFNFDLSRNRILSIIDLEFFVPFTLYVLFTQRKKLVPIITFTLLSFSVYLTMYRYRFLTFVVGSFSYIVSAFSSVGKKIIFMTAGLFFVIFGIYMLITISLGKTTIIDRFLLENKSEDYDSIRRRFVMIDQAVALFKEHPLLGVGIGNYKDNVQVTYAMFGGRQYEPYYKILQNVYAYPHNWFIQTLAENGIVGFSALMYLLYTFASIDVFLVKKLRGDDKLSFLTFSVSSWLYVFANQFTPLSNSQPMVIFFWTFRGIIERIHYDQTYG